MLSPFIENVGAVGHEIPAYTHCELPENSLRKHSNFIMGVNKSTCSYCKTVLSFGRKKQTSWQCTCWMSRST